MSPFLLRCLLVVSVLLAVPAQADTTSELKQQITNQYAPLIESAIAGDFDKLQAALPAGLTVTFSDLVKLDQPNDVLTHLTRLRELARNEVTYTYDGLNITNLTVVPPNIILARGDVSLGAHPLGGGQAIVAVGYTALLVDRQLYALYLSQPSLPAPVEKNRAWTDAFAGQGQAGALLAGFLIGMMFVLVINTVRASQKDK